MEVSSVASQGWHRWERWREKGSALTRLGPARLGGLPGLLGSPSLGSTRPEAGRRPARPGRLIQSEAALPRLDGQINHRERGRGDPFGCRYRAPLPRQGICQAVEYNTLKRVRCGIPDRRRGLSHLQIASAVPSGPRGPPGCLAMVAGGRRQATRTAEEGACALPTPV